MAESPGSADADAISRELTRARQRGLDDLEVDEGPQRHRVETPHLDQLADVYGTATGIGPLSRVDGVKRLMRDGLARYEAAGNREYASFIRDLFFDAEGSPPGSAGERLEAVRRRTGLNERNFQARRHTAFREFASFLSDFAAQARPASTAESVGSVQLLVRTLGHRRPLIWVSACLIIGVSVVVGLWLSGRPSAVPPTVSTPAPSSVMPATSVALTFDALGGGSTIIQVYPGVQNNPADKLANGTFRNGDTVRATCQTIGRTITSVPSEGERFVQSNRWVRVVGTPELTQYASLTYANIAAADLAALPMCPSSG